MIALLEARRAGLLAPGHWPANLLAGLIVGIVALPLAMAFAIASGLRPEQGIYTAIVAGFLVAAFGGSRVQIAGPTGAFIVILADVTARHGVEGLQVATLMAGVMLLLMGIARLGAVIRFIPAPVITGFTAGIAVIIFIGQWPAFLGLPALEGEHFHQKLAALGQSLPQFHPATLLIGVLSLLLVIFSRRLPGMARVPGPLVALVAGALLQAAVAFDGVATIGSSFGGIPAGLPLPGLPELSLERMLVLLGPAFTIAMLGAIESLLSAVVADGMAGTRHDPNQELIGQGIANIATPLFAGFAATGAIARTATNVRNGGSSPVAGMTHALVLVLILLFLAPLAASIPLATLAAILFVVAWNMSEAKHFARTLRRAPRADVLILLVTFLLTVLADLVVAVNIGIILAVLHFMRRMADSVEFGQTDPDELARELAAEGHPPLPERVMVCVVQGPFFFGVAERFEQSLAITGNDPDILIIRLKWVPFMDMTAIDSLDEAIANFQRRGVRVILTGANERVQAKLSRAGVLHRVGPQGHYPSFGAAVTALSTPSATSPGPG